LAATALLSTSRHQASPSMGPDLIADLKPEGSSASMALRRALDSRVKAVRCDKVGESAAACCTVNGRWDRRMAAAGFANWGDGFHYPRTLRTATVGGCLGSHSGTGKIERLWRPSATNGLISASNAITDSK
jgi:hypothetical protein